MKLNYPWASLLPIHLAPRSKHRDTKAERNFSNEKRRRKIAKGSRARNRR